MRCPRRFRGDTRSGVPFAEDRARLRASAACSSTRWLVLRASATAPKGRCCAKRGAFCPPKAVICRRPGTAVRVCSTRRSSSPALGAVFGGCCGRPSVVAQPRPRNCRAQIWSNPTLVAWSPKQIEQNQKAHQLARPRACTKHGEQLLPQRAGRSGARGRSSCRIRRSCAGADAMSFNERSGKRAAHILGLWAEFCRHWANSGRNRPALAECDSAEMGPVEFVPKFGQFGPTSANLLRPTLGRVRSIRGRARPISSKFGPGSAKFAANSARPTKLCTDSTKSVPETIKFGPISENIKLRPILARHRPMLAEVPPNLTQKWPTSTRIVPFDNTWHEVDQVRLVLAWHRPASEKIWATRGGGTMIILER